MNRPKRAPGKLGTTATMVTGGSGSGLFTEDARLIAMRSASLDMNAKRPFDIETHYGSALLFEGELLEVIKSDVQKKP